MPSIKKEFCCKGEQWAAYPMFHFIDNIELFGRSLNDYTCICNAMPHYFDIFNFWKCPDTVNDPKVGNLSCPWDFYIQQSVWYVIGELPHIILLQDI